MGIYQVGGTRAAFFDRDGVLNRNAFNPATGSYESPLSPAQLELSEGVVEALVRLRAAGYLLVIVSNQPNYAKGKCRLETLDAIHARLEHLLEDAGIMLTAAYYCFHHPQGEVPSYSVQCRCRKPLPYFLFCARDTFGISLHDSWMIGDRAVDIECGAAAGTRTIRVAPDHPCDPDITRLKADFAAANLAEAAEIILRGSPHRVAAAASVPSEYPAATASE